MKRFAHILLAVFVIGLICQVSASESFAALKIYVQIDGVRGESQDKDHRDWIDAMSVSHQIEALGTTAGTTATRDASRVNVGDIVITKFLDKASPHLYIICAGRHHLPKVTIEITGGTENLVIMRYTLFEVSVSSTSTASSTGEGLATERVSLRFGKIKWEYIPYRADGRDQGVVEKNWSIVENKEG